jgi:acetolactate synthase-1/2/3 large subunit
MMRVPRCGACVGRAVSLAVRGAQAEEGATLTIEEPTGTGAAERVPRYGSDLAVDALNRLGYRYLPMNPGSSFRGFHDSIVNYGGNTAPQLLLCLHEEIAVSLAHGYAKASGRPAAAAVHDLVGLMHASMAIYNAACDVAPILLIGGSGPANPLVRRPIDWLHSANTQGGFVRDYVKWDAEAATPESFSAYLSRAHAIAHTGPAGPTYVSLDAEAQEAELGPDAAQSDWTMPPLVPRLQPDPELVARAADMLASAKSVVVVAGRTARDPQLARSLVELVEALGAAYQDERNTVCFPTAHEHNCNGDIGLLDDADVILAIGVGDLAGVLKDRIGVPPKRGKQRSVIDISFGDLGLRAWSNEGGPPRAADVQLVGDHTAATSALLEAVRGQVSAADAQRRAAAVRQRSAALRERHRRSVQERWTQQPVAPARLVSEVWNCVQDLDWLLLLRNTRSWPEGVWQFRGIGDYVGDSGGGGVGYGPGAMVGGAIAARDAGRFPVGIVGDGDFLMAAGALWTAVHYEIPMLMVVNDNGSLYNDEEHQRAVALHRGRPVENSWIGMRISDPPVDIADLARSYGCWATGPITEPDDLAKNLAEARNQVLDGAVAVVHVRTSPK